jgi:hypothetical protein
MVEKEGVSRPRLHSLFYNTGNRVSFLLLLLLSLSQ